jgi:outer membrane protein, multidrug efflux system
MLKKLTLTLFVTLGISGCALTPKHVTDQEQFNNTQAHLNQVLSDQEPVHRRLTLAQAIARALKYNLDHRVQQAQLMLESGSLKLAYMEMLPSLNVEANYSFRNNAQIQNLVQDGQVVQGDQSFTPRRVLSQNRGLEWNMLDLGLSYTRAQQQANRIMMAVEQRRKVTQQLVQETTTAYWKAYTAQQMMNRVLRFKRKVTRALDRSKQLTTHKVRSADIELDYQHLLLKAIRRANELHRDIAGSRSELSRLINVKPSTPFILVGPTRSMRNLPRITVKLQKLDLLAMIYRPELREASYQNKISGKDIQAAWINIFPGIKFDFGYNQTDNVFMKNSSWYGGNVNASWNLIQAVLTGPQQIRLARRNYEFQQLKQLALTMTVLTQIRVAYHNYLLWTDDYRYAAEETRVAKKQLRQALNLEKASQGDQQKSIRRGIDELNIEFDRDITYAKAQEALSKLYQAVGIDLLPSHVRSLSLKQLTQRVKLMLVSESNGMFNTVVNARYKKLLPMLKRNQAKAAAYQKKLMKKKQLMQKKQLKKPVKKVPVKLKTRQAIKKH